MRMPSDNASFRPTGLGWRAVVRTRGAATSSGAAAATGDYGKFKVVKLGVLKIAAPGKVTIAVRPVKDGWHPVNLKAIRLKPVAANQ